MSFSRTSLLLPFAVLAPLSLVLAGCGNGMSATDSVGVNVPSAAMSGKLLGGQNPIVGATISVYAYGTTGYGSPATLLASTTTGAGGSFSFASGSYTCPQSDTPVYLMSTGGDTGSGTNINSTLTAALGTCTNAQSSYVVINEVTTVAMAYALSHYFNTTLGGVSPANDSFGGPTTTLPSGTVVYSRGLVRGNRFTAALMATTQNGYATASSGNFVAEQQKVYTLANILFSCVNSQGYGGTGDTTSTCSRLFSNTTYGSSVPSDTLQAAVQIALHPQQNVANLFSLPSTKVAFANSLSTQPSDWSIAVSYTSSTLGLSVDNNTQSTMDIDTNGFIWFPSNAAGQVGLAMFDPTSSTFSGPYNSTGMVHPQQVAIDKNGYAWLADTQGPGGSAYNTVAPTSAVPFALPNTTSYAVSVAPDSSIRYSLYDSSLAKYRLATIAATAGSATTGTLTELAAPSLPAGYLPVSLALDSSSNLYLAQFNPTVPRMYDSTLTAGGTYTLNAGTAGDNAGQIAYTGSDLVGIRSFNNAAGPVDGFCFYSGAICYSVKGASAYTGASGLAVDGAKTLWVANTQRASVASAPLVNGSYLNTSTSPSQIQTYQYTHNSSNGNTMVRPEGIAVDFEGNVWVANAGCLTTGCTPGSFTLTELIGAAAPTVTPIAAQIAGGTSLAGTQPAY